VSSPQKTFPRFLRPSAVEAEYGIAAGTLANWRAAGKGPKFVRLSCRQIFYAREALEKFFDDRMIEPTGAGLEAVRKGRKG
jgi:hypothetical protein